MQESWTECGVASNGPGRQTPGAKQKVRPASDKIRQARGMGGESSGGVRASDTGRKEERKMIKE